MTKSQDQVSGSLRTLVIGMTLVAGSPRTLVSGIWPWFPGHREPWSVVYDPGCQVTENPGQWYMTLVSRSPRTLVIGIWPWLPGHREPWSLYGIPICMFIDDVTAYINNPRIERYWCANLPFSQDLLISAWKTHNINNSSKWPNFYLTCLSTKLGL
jgi:hypothetical protein